MKLLLAFPVCALLLAGCVQSPAATPQTTEATIVTSPTSTPIDIFVRTLVINTSDGYNISATWRTPLVGRPRANVILLHGVGGTQREFDELATMLARNRYSALTIDFRGHGESLHYQGRSFQSFSARDYASMEYDVQAAYDVLSANQLPAYIIGASVGSSIALAFASNVQDIRGVALLSPGVNYRGIGVDQSALDYGRRSLFIAASKEDGYAYESSQTIAAYARQSGATPTLELYAGAGHGTRMLSHTELPRAILRWLDAQST